jgi:organic hydroperoxide reductase OsmC/OhrA
MEQKKTSRTFQFGNVAVWKSEFRGTLSAPGHPNVEVGNPLVFKGSGDVWCTEDLLIGVLNACLMLTLLHQMRRRKLEALAYESSAQGMLEHRDGKHRALSLKSGHDMEAAREAIKDTVDSCMISNSILATVQVDPQFDAPLRPAQ